MIYFILKETKNLANTKYYIILEYLTSALINEITFYSTISVIIVLTASTTTYIFDQITLIP